MMSYEQVKKEFIDNIDTKSNEIDPDNEFHWPSLAYGFFLAKGFDSNNAYESANQMLNEIWS